MYEIIRMHFGLKIALSTIHCTIDVILAAAKWQIALVYVDEIVIYSKSPEEHVGHVHGVSTL